MHHLSRWHSKLTPRVPKIPEERQSKQQSLLPILLFKAEAPPQEYRSSTTGIQKFHHRNTVHNCSQAYFTDQTRPKDSKSGKLLFSMPSRSSKSWQEFMLTWSLLVATDYNSIPSAFPFPKKSKTSIRSYVSILNPHIFTPGSERKRINSPHYRCESHYLTHFWKMLKYHSDRHTIRIWKAQNRNRMEKGSRAQQLAIHTDTQSP